MLKDMNYKDLDYDDEPLDKEGLLNRLNDMRNEFRALLHLAGNTDPYGEDFATQNLEYAAVLVDDFCALVADHV
jgi:hypothetical protein